MEFQSDNMVTNFSLVKLQAYNQGCKSMLVVTTTMSDMLNPLAPGIYGSYFKTYLKQIVVIDILRISFPTAVR